MEKFMHKLEILHLKNHLKIIRLKFVNTVRCNPDMTCILFRISRQQTQNQICATPVLLKNYHKTWL